MVTLFGESNQTGGRILDSLELRYVLLRETKELQAIAVIYSREVTRA